MKKLIIATAAAVLLGAPLALAASTTTTTTTTPTTTTKPATQHASLMQQCHSLGVQFDKAEPKHKADKNFNDALAMRKEGKSLCVSHKETDGIKKIEDALTMIGVKPMVKS
jgi:hypothetical protein